MSRRVVITGMGWVTPLGSDVCSVWSRLVAGQSGIGPITRFDASTFATDFAGEVRDFRLADFLEPSADRPDHHRHAGLNSQFALAAAAQAWRQAALGRWPGFDGTRMGIYLGAGEGSLDFERFASTHLDGWDPARRAVDDGAWASAARGRLVAAVEMEQEPNTTLSHLAAEFGCRGPSFNCMTACAASTQAIGEAFEIIRRGDADLMFAGGSHTMIHPLGMTGFIRLTAMSTRRDTPTTAARPFDSTRDGFVMGEGAGVVVLEEYAHAKARGAKMYAEVVGYGMSGDGYHITSPDETGDGGERAMRTALQRSGLDPSEIDYVNSHGTSTPAGDEIEVRAVERVLGKSAAGTHLSSTKSAIGHLLGAAGAVEAAFCALAIRDGILPPTLNLDNPSFETPLNLIPHTAVRKKVRAALSNSFGFGGTNAALVLKQLD